MTVPRNWWNTENVDDKSRLQAITLFLKDVYNILKNGLTFQDNFRGAIVSATFNNVAEEVKIEHGLSYAPSYFIIIDMSDGVILYKSKDFDSKYVYLAAGTGGGSATIFVF